MDLRKKVLIAAAVASACVGAAALYAQGDTRMMPGRYVSASTDRVVLVTGWGNPYAVTVTDGSGAVIASGAARVDGHDIYVDFGDDGTMVWFFNPFDRFEFIVLTDSNALPAEAEFRHSSAPR